MDLEDYDLILGYRADDSYFSFARAFISNTISIAQLEKAMYLGELGTQYFIKSEKALDKYKRLYGETRVNNLISFMEKDNEAAK